MYSWLYAPFVEIFITEYCDTHITGLFNIAITSLFPSLYSWLSIVHCKFSIVILVIVSADGLFTLNFTLAVSFVLSRISIDSISGKSLSSTSGNSIYSCVGIQSGQFNWG